MNNPIIEEVRAARAALAAEHGHDLQRIHEWAKAAHEARKKSGRRSDAGKGEIPGARVTKGKAMSGAKR